MCSCHLWGRAKKAENEVIDGIFVTSSTTSSTCRIKLDDAQEPSAELLMNQPYVVSALESIGASALRDVQDDLQRLKQALAACPSDHFAVLAKVVLARRN